MIPAHLRARLGEEAGGVFYLHGGDEHAKDAAARALARAHLEEATADFNREVLRGREVTPQSLASTLATPPMMAPWRVVTLRETQSLAGSPRLRTVVLEAAASPPPGLALILLCTRPERSRARFYRDLEARCRSMRFEVPRGQELHGWLIGEAQEAFGRSLSEAAARALARAFGSNLPALHHELEKLSALAGEEGGITTEHVRRAGTAIIEQDRWAWFDLVAERKWSEALRGLRILIGHGESGVGLVIGLASHLLRLGAVATGGSAALGAALPGNQKWLVRKYERQARGWTPAGIERALAGLLRVERLLKASGAPDLLLLEHWLLDQDQAAEAA